MVPGSGQAERRRLAETGSTRNPDATHEIREPRIAANASHSGIHPDPGYSSRALKVRLLERGERLLGVAEINVASRDDEPAQALGPRRRSYFSSKIRLILAARARSTRYSRPTTFMKVGSVRVNIRAHGQTVGVRWSDRYEWTRALWPVHSIGSWADMKYGQPSRGHRIII
jgi:hypothetical protein